VQAQKALQRDELGDEEDGRLVVEANGAAAQAGDFAAPGHARTRGHSAIANRRRPAASRGPGPRIEAWARQCWDLGYMGTYSPDRQPVLDRLLLEPARRWREGRFIVAGAQYPADGAWPVNVARVEHVSPTDHASFYNAQRFTLNVTRRDMAVAGYSPSVRLFEAAACGTPIISDAWEGLDSIFTVGSEILVARSAEEVCDYLSSYDEERRIALGAPARARVLAEHTAAHRAGTLERYLAALSPSSSSLSSGAALAHSEPAQRAAGMGARATSARQPRMSR
jgi:Glycosyl transferases group 1